MITDAIIIVHAISRRLECPILGFQASVLSKLDDPEKGLAILIARERVFWQKQYKYDSREPLRGPYTSLQRGKGQFFHSMFATVARFNNFGPPIVTNIFTRVKERPLAF